MEDIGSDKIAIPVVAMGKRNPSLINIHCRYFVSSAALKHAGNHLSLTASDVETR